MYADQVPVMVRPSVPADAPALIDLMYGYFDFYEVSRPAAGGLVEHLHRIWDDPARGHQLVAERDGGLVGFATLYASLETLAMAPILVMNDLFVVPDARGAGIGERLIEACREYARDNGFASLDWVTAADNHTARKLYDRVGGRVGPWVSYSLDPGRRPG